MKDGPARTGQAAYDEALAQLRAAEDEFLVNYDAWLAAGRPVHEFSPLVPDATACGTCGRTADADTHPARMTAAAALAALDSRPRTGPGTGLSEKIQPAELIPLRNLARAVRWEQQAGSVAAALRMVDEARAELLLVTDDPTSERDAYTGALEALADAVRGRAS